MPLPVESLLRMMYLWLNIVYCSYNHKIQNDINVTNMTRYHLLRRSKDVVYRNKMCVVSPSNMKLFRLSYLDLRITYEKLCDTYSSST